MTFASFLSLYYEPDGRPIVADLCESFSRQDLRLFYFDFDTPEYVGFARFVVIDTALDVSLAHRNKIYMNSCFFFFHLRYSNLGSNNSATRYRIA